MKSTWRDAAIQNNMDWYCAECDALGIGYERTESTWHTTRPMPAFHSNLITTNTDDVDFIAWLDKQIEGEWSIKDARATHDLHTLHFDRLFDARWHVLETDMPPPNDQASLTLVATPEQFAKWIALWGETPPDRAVFDAGLLRNAAVGFFYADRPTCRGGLAFNHSRDVIGITNTFGDIVAIRSAVAQLRAQYVDKPVVGFDREQEFAQLQQLGFRTTGALTIWRKAVR